TGLVVGFDVDGIIIVDELVGGRGWWCSGGVGGNEIRCSLEVEELSGKGLGFDALLAILVEMGRSRMTKDFIDAVKDYYCCWSSWKRLSGYKVGLKSVEERLKFFKNNESIYSEDIKKLKFKIHCNEITIRELRKKLETVQREKYGIQLTVKKLKNASKNLNKLIDSQIVDKCKKGLGYNAVPPPHTGLFMPLKPDLSYICLGEFTSEHAVKTLNAKTSEDVPKVVKKDNGASIIEV
nr:hypothetical protein [Tanacetum cinerariifolium]